MQGHAREPAISPLRRSAIVNTQTASRLLSGLVGVVAVANVVFGVLAMLLFMIAFALSQVFHWVLKLFFPNLRAGHDPTHYYLAIFILFPVLLAAAYFSLPWNLRLRAWIVSATALLHWAVLAAYQLRDYAPLHYTLPQQLTLVALSTLHWPVVSSVGIAVGAWILWALRAEPPQLVPLSEGS